jgi:glucose-6-phosphate dehydrogenase assembly protein OpcA
MSGRGEADVWQKQDASPDEIEAALRRLLFEAHQQEEDHVPARVLNMVAIVDRDWRGEILNRLEHVGRYQASRLVLCAVEDGRDSVDASVAMITDDGAAPGQFALMHERVLLDIGPRHLERLDTLVDPLVVPDIATLAWAPHGHAEGLDALMRLAQIMLVDSVNEPDPAAAVKRAAELSESAYVVDLAWLRSTPWRERVAASFDPPQWLPELGRLTSVTVRHQTESAVAGLLFCGWLCSRLGWEPGSLSSANGSLRGRAKAKRQEVELRLEPDKQLDVPGLAGVALETASGMKIELDRGPGGLSASRTDPAGHSSEWTVLGASRGEGGILGEGIRQALLRDPTYAPALAAATTMLG